MKTLRKVPAGRGDWGRTNDNERDGRGPSGFSGGIGLREIIH